VGLTNYREPGESARFLILAHGEQMRRGSSFLEAFKETILRHSIQVRLRLGGRRTRDLVEPRAVSGDGALVVGIREPC